MYRSAKDRRERKAWAFTFVIWGIGVAVLWMLWSNRVFVNDIAEAIFGFILYVVAFFYLLALWPIYHLVDGRLPKALAEEEPYSRGIVQGGDNPPEIRS
jgi:hypothetical protein